MGRGVYYYNIMYGTGAAGMLALNDLGVPEGAILSTQVEIILW